MKKLNRKNKTTSPVKILQFGEGNFLRAFIDDFFQILNDKKLFDGSVCVVQPIEFGRVQELSEQDGLYTLIIEGIKDGKVSKTTKIVEVLSDFVNPYTELDKYLAYARSEDLEFIISNTTEAGIVYEEEMISRNHTPKSFPAKLLLFLYERYHHFGGSKASGLEIIPCELIDDNSDKLLEILIKLAKYNKLSNEFINWLQNDNYYFNTLVDRIVPGYPKNDIEEITKELGYIDHSIVKCEVFHFWVLQKNPNYQSKLEGPFKNSGLDVFFVDDIKPYKERKVKILNGTHTAMVPVSYLIGHEAVRESIEDPKVLKFVNSFLTKEVIPTINLPLSELKQFSKDVLERYQNPFIHHLLMSIALNSVSKFKSRILPTILESKELGLFPKYALFSLAALIRFYQGVDEKGNQIKLNDDPKFLTLFKELWAANDLYNLVVTVLNMKFWETDYLGEKEVVDFVYKYLKLICESGTEKALDLLLKEAK
ncbi:MAG: tagaturonate reductase [Acholeplasmataceae bacterium]